MFFEAFDRIDAALSIAIPLLVLLRFLVVKKRRFCVYFLLKARARSLYLYLRDNSGIQIGLQPLSRKA